MRIQLRQVQGFLATADTLSFSQLLREFESTLEVKPFERSTRRARITATGAQ